MGMQAVNSANISVVNNLSAVNKSNQQNKKRFTDNFATKIKNSADMNDTVNVPRTIFKGYLGFMIGTAAMTVAALIKNPRSILKKSLNLAAVALTTYGTWAFVRPYIIKDKKSSVCDKK